MKWGVPPFKETPISKNLQFFTLNEGVPTSMAHCRFRVATASLQALGKRWKTGEDLGMLIFEKPWVYESCVFWKVSRSGWFWWNNQIQQIPKQQNLTFFWYKIRKPRKSKDQTLPIGSRESFTWIILKTILCLVLDSQGKHIHPVKLTTQI